MERAINAIVAKTEEFDVRTIADCDPPTEQHYLCFVTCQIRILLYSQAAVLASSGGAGLMTKETHRNFARRRFSMTARGLIDILLAGISTSISQTLRQTRCTCWNSWLVHQHQMLRCATYTYWMTSLIERKRLSKQFNSTYLVHAVHYNRLDRQDEQLDRRSPVKELDANAN